MPRQPKPKTRSPWTIPLAAGPVAAWVDRSIAILIVAVASAAFVALIGLEPDGKGYDTHTQLGMDACGWPLTYGIPCPTCGCTTAACHLVHGSIVEAFVAQPFGAALALFGLLLGVHALICLIRRRSFVDVVVRAPFGWIVIGAVLLWLLAWVYKCLTFTG